jgi:hypothetical protein
MGNREDFGDGMAGNIVVQCYNPCKVEVVNGTYEGCLKGWFVDRFVGRRKVAENIVV